jgi:putative serine protease PepD
MLGGVVATAGLLWLAQAGTADTSITTDPIAIGSTGTRTPGTNGTPGASLTQISFPPGSSSADSRTPAAQSPQTAPRPENVAVSLSAGTEPLAGAVMVREGFVITSGRALAGAENVVLTWGTRTETGVVIGYDAVTDVSVIRVDGDTPGRLGVDAEVTAGDVVTLAGPDTRESVHTVVDATSTSARIDGEPVIGIVELDRTLGVVPPGSPAFDANGALVGMTTETADNAPAAVVPIELVRDVADQIIENGAATHPRLGVTARNPGKADGVEANGSFVTDVTVDGPADLGGVEVGDLIIEIGGEPIDSMEKMVATLRSHQPGDAVTVVVLRAGEAVDCPVELGSQPETTT